MKNTAALVGAILVLVPAGARTEVADSSPSGFTVNITLEISAPPAEVYRRVVQNVGDWWSSEHTFSRDSHNLSIEEKAMGCFCEKLPNQGVVRHMEVVFIAPGKMLRLSGGLGPFQALAVTGSMTLAFSPVPGGTKLDVTYTVVGYTPQGMNTWAPRPWIQS